MHRVSAHRDQRGAIIIHVAIALLALIAFSAFVIDAGAMWVGRRQAQNTADAGALSGAVALMRDGGDLTEAAKSAHHWAGTNLIWGTGNSTTNVQVTFSGSSGTCGPSCTVESIPPCDDQRGCVRVDVFRNMPDRADTTRGAAIPTFFAPLVGITTQGVRATATAEVASGNIVTCLKPWTIPDKWDEGGGAPWTVFDTYDPAAGDSYTPPYQSPHSGYTVEEHRGLQLVLKTGDVGLYSSGWTNLVQLPDAPGTPPYRANVEGCNPTRVGIATETRTCTTTDWEAGCIDVQSGEHNDTPLAVNTLYNGDSGARWGTLTDGTPGIVNSNGSGSRIIPLALFDMADAYTRRENGELRSGTNAVVKVVNILGFFLEGMCDDVAARGQLMYPLEFCGSNPGERGKVVVGRLYDYLALEASGPGLVDESAAFLQVTRLVR